jgi:hypothetical protein
MPKDIITTKFKTQLWKHTFGIKVYGCCQLNCGRFISIPTIVRKSLKITDKLKPYPSGEYGHIQSEANGGKISNNNIKIICVNCNRTMGTQHMDEYLPNMVIDDNITFMAVDDNKLKKNQCNGITYKLNRCRAKCIDDSLFCNLHKEYKIACINA